MDQSQIHRVEDQISQFYEVTKNALMFRLKPWGEYSSARMRAEGLAEQMIDATNVVTDLEEKLSLMLIVQQHIDMVWDDSVAAYLENNPFLTTGKYKSFKEIQYSAIAAHSELYALKKRLDACVEAGKRGVDRLQSLHAVASRAAGIAHSV